jgi:hypothetical protein
VNCLGACALGPVVVLNNKYHHHITPGKLRKMIDAARDKETEGTSDGKARQHKKSRSVALKA